MDSEEKTFQRKLIDTAKRAWQKNYPSFTGFLSLSEQNILFLSSGELSFIEMRLFGGYSLAERRMAAFIPDSYGSIIFPLVCLKITCLDRRFTSMPGHRDFLGSVLGLGIDRSRIGDILISEDHAFMFCHSDLSAFICSELTHVKHSPVRCQVSDCRFELPDQKFEEITGTVASPRMDAMLSLTFGKSRSQLAVLPSQKRVFINGRTATDPSVRLRPGDLVSVRGFGRFLFAREGSKSKKGRQYVTVHLFH